MAERENRAARIRKFIVVGLVSAGVNFILMAVLVDVLGFRSFFLKNLANVVSIELSILFNFLVQRRWTWQDAPARRGTGLLRQIASFNLAALTTMLLRVVVFAGLEKLGVFYLVNVAIGIGAASAINYILYDKIVFRRLANPDNL